MKDTNDEKLWSYQRKNTPFARAVNHLGGISITAQILGKARQTIWHWVNRAKSPRLTLKECRKIEYHTDGLFTAKMLRPDFFKK